MKRHWLTDLFLYVLGLFFNIALIVIVISLVNDYTQKGYAFGEEFSKELTKEMPNREVVFVLEEDTPRDEVAQRLEELGVIRNRYLFQLEVFLKGSAPIYRAGTYTLNQSMSSTEVNIALRTQPAEVLPDVIITIPEGFTIQDIAAYLAENEIMAAADFISACESYDRGQFSFLSGLPERPNSLEGYLFPDTYYLSPEPEAEEVIDKMLARFDEIFTDELRRRAEELDITIDEAVIMASIIEEEVRVAGERPLVSQVIYNRLNSGTKLEMDCTVQYALDKRQERLLYSDLEVDSPYNTYLNPGLPIGPITNPGEDCLRAALFPEEGDLVYYVLKDEESGEHFFTNDYNEFLAARDQYLP